jgi:hypothetical protein
VTLVGWWRAPHSPSKISRSQSAARPAGWFVELIIGVYGSKPTTIVGLDDQHAHMR